MGGNTGQALVHCPCYCGLRGSVTPANHHTGKTFTTRHQDSSPCNLCALFCTKKLLPEMPQSQNKDRVNRIVSTPLAGVEKKTPIGILGNVHHPVVS